MKLTRRGIAFAMAGTAFAGIATDAAASTFQSGDRRCATCEFWSGQRSLAADKSSVTVAPGATGTCGNPQSPLFNRQARADQLFANGYRRWKELG